MRCLKSISVCALLITAGAFAASPAAFAQNGSGGGGGNSNQYTLSQQTYDRVNRVQKLLGDNKYDKARTLAKDVLPAAKKESKFAQALVDQLIAQTYLLQKNFDAAEPYLEEVVKLDALQPQSQQSVIEELATIYLSQEKYDDSIRLYKEVIADKEAKAKKLGKKASINPELYYRLGLAYSFKSDFPEAMTNIEKAIHMASKPHKDWYQNWFIVAYKMKNYDKANSIAKQLVVNWPDDKDFWTYYANTALLLHNDEQATAVYQLMYKRGMVKSRDEYLQLVNLLLEQNAPYKAGKLLQEGLDKGIVPKTADNYDALATAWMQARDWNNALDALGKEAQLATTGAVYLHQASIYLNQQDYAKAQAAAQNAINKGGLDHPGRAWMVLGQSAFEQKDWSTALNAFHKAENYHEQAKNAKSWIQYVMNSRKNGGPSGGR